MLVGHAMLTWLLLALALHDAEHFWLPDKLTYPGIGLGFGFTLLLNRTQWFFDNPTTLPQAAERSLIAILASAALILVIRLAYWLVRRKEGMGLGDAKLMAMLGAWLGLIGALECFVLAIFAASAAALIWLIALALRRDTGGWAQMPLPFGTFLCLAALGEIFYPNWLWTWWSQTFSIY
jgi:leader peptidase (prepilin peptidase)/N-methyltransferase